MKWIIVVARLAKDLKINAILPSWPEDSACSERQCHLEWQAGWREVFETMPNLYKPYESKLWGKETHSYLRPKLYQETFCITDSRGLGFKIIILMWLNIFKGARYGVEMHPVYGSVKDAKIWRVCGSCYWHLKA